MVEWVSYQRQNGINSASEWMAYVVMPNGKLWMVPSFGNTETEAVNKIVALWEAERAKYKVNGSIGEHHLAGLVWVIHKETREKKRVSQQEAEGLMAFGEWERGGPRSK